MKITRFIIPLLVALGFALNSTAREKGEVAEGILVSKDKNSITVLVDGAKEPMRFTPHWHGGAPKDGGGLDKKMLEKIRDLIVTNRVRVKWEYEERHRVVEVQVLKPKSKRGTVRGTVVSKGKNHVDVKPADGGPVERYLPHWRGNGLDKDVLRQLAPLAVGQKVSVRWEYDERKRVLSIR
ncbi:MAG: hypothetical protein VCA36_09730, partial [Opitutales bacterium]